MKFKKIVTSALVVLSLFSIMSPSIASVVVFADDVTTTEVSEISTQEQKQIDDVANVLEQMFRNGVNEKNFTEYVYKNFSQKDIALAENELETNINNPYDRVPWDEMGGCIAGKIRDEFFAIINVSLIVKYAQKKAWSELAKVVLRFVKANGLKTNIYIIAGQLAIWAVQCGLE
ncbi:streptococcin A-M57 [Streptococcus pneumoniae]|nr:streptococcin A-M57 [Streptococcus pneumoniae]MDS2593030.1 streptococcin A-M57 [Streptococcus pneumoniae]MDS3051056.1 streptococcin A-M57 [Streptococcus pneumoniae]MDS3835249.1 streptococcin A-M57 [Streptococcus pneumoniae]MDS4432331.1 streptococcin A-M57 [Streptococcus pneumoniae]